jgi:hypothetical protein
MTRRRQRLLSAATCSMLLSSLPLAVPTIAAQDGAAPPCTTAVPYPDALHITAPDSSVPAALSTLVGVWEGITNIGVPNRLVVERVDGATATGFRLNGDGPNTRGSIVRFVAQATPEGRIQWLDGDVRFSYVLGSDRSTVLGAREQAGSPITTVVLQRCT